MDLAENALFELERKLRLNDLLLRKIVLARKMPLSRNKAKAQFPVSGIFRAGGILDNKKLLSRNYLFNFRATFSPSNNRISARSENCTDWKSAFKRAGSHTPVTVNNLLSLESIVLLTRGHSILHKCRWMG